MNTTLAPLLQVEGLTCRIAGATVVDGVGFTLAAGELAALLGPSGCGKSTTLRAVAGFQPPAAGSIMLRGVQVADARSAMPPERRGIGFVFQDLALFPHLDVTGNIGFGLHHLTATDRAQRVAGLIERLELQGMQSRRPHELSGGQQQRVAVARALALQPDLLLLDEPFSSLDARLRVRLREQMRSLLKSLGVAALLVSHDQEEAFAFADRIGVMQHGRIEQWDTPYELYHRPATRFVAGFVGEGRLLPGIVGSDGRIATALGALPTPDASMHAGTRVEVLIRPDDLRPASDSGLRATVVDVAFRGADTLYRLRLDDGAELDALFTSHHVLQPGSTIGIETDIEHVVAFATD